MKHCENRLQFIEFRIYVQKYIRFEKKNQLICADLLHSTSRMTRNSILLYVMA